MLATLTLRQRQDLFCVLNHWLISLGPQPDAMAVHDTVQLEVELEPGCMASKYVFAVCRRALLEEVRWRYADLRQYTSQVSAKHTRAEKDCLELDPSLCVLSDNVDVCSEFLRPEILRTLNQYADLVELVHFTDQAPPQHAQLAADGSELLTSPSRAQQRARFIFRIPPPEDIVSKLGPLIKMAIAYCIDHGVRLQLSQHATRKASKARGQVEELLLKSENAKRQATLARRQAQKRAAQQQQLLSLSGAEQRKLETKIEREEERRLRRRAKEGKLRG